MKDSEGDIVTLISRMPSEVLPVITPVWHSYLGCLTRTLHSWVQLLTLP